MMLEIDRLTLRAGELRKIRVIMIGVPVWIALKSLNLTKSGEKVGSVCNRIRRRMPSHFAKVNKGGSDCPFLPG